LVPQSAVSNAVGDPEASSPAAAPAGSVVLSGCRIMLAEDEDSIREYIGRFLRSMGCDVQTAVNGRETVEALRGEKRFDLILSDLRMPGMDGEELYSWVLAHKPELLKRMIFLTGDLGSPRSREFLSSTGVAYLEKPIVTSKLARVIADAMRQSGPVGN
jgi:CheY-like chemotaxis protein